MRGPSMTERPPRTSNFSFLKVVLLSHNNKVWCSYHRTIFTDISQNYLHWQGEKMRHDQRALLGTWLSSRHWLATRLPRRSACRELSKVESRQGALVSQGSDLFNFCLFFIFVKCPLKSSLNAGIAFLAPEARTHLKLGCFVSEKRHLRRFLQCWRRVCVRLSERACVYGVLPESCVCVCSLLLITHMLLCHRMFVIRQHTPAYARQHTSAYVTWFPRCCMIRQHTSAYVSIRTSAYVTWLPRCCMAPDICACLSSSVSALCSCPRASSLSFWHLIHRER